MKNTNLSNYNHEKYDAIIIGAGLCGSVIARYLAQDCEKKVLILERRNHIGGNMYDYRDENGILVHKYGPHVFHTYNDELFKYMEKYSEWKDFSIKCRVFMKGKFTPSPFNLKTIEDYYSKENSDRLKEEIKKEYPSQEKTTIVELLENKNPIIKEYAKFLFESDYSLYTAKQWGISPSEIDPSVLKRVPVLFSYKDGYFDDTYQKLPVNGYTVFFENLLNHSNIEIKLNVDSKQFISINDNKIYFDGSLFQGTVVYTGALDELFDCEFGRLPYRSLEFKWETIKTNDFFQEAPLVAYPEDKIFTRIVEYKHFLNQHTEGVSSISYEIPVKYQKDKEIEPYYPILTEESQKLFQLYMRRAEGIKNLYLCGRLATFKYFNMDQALEQALLLCKKLK